MLFEAGKRDRGREGETKSRPLTRFPSRTEITCDRMAQVTGILTLFVTARGVEELQTVDPSAVFSFFWLHELAEALQEFSSFLYNSCILPPGLYTSS